MYIRVNGYIYECISISKYLHILISIFKSIKTFVYICLYHFLSLYLHL